MLTSGELSSPGRIDAHLLNAAMDGTSIQLTVGSTELGGRLDLADDFGQISVLPGSHTPELMHIPNIEPGTPVEVRYRYKGQVWWFCARLLKRSRRNRWSLLRPMRVFYTNNT